MYLGLMLSPSFRFENPLFYGSTSTFLFFVFYETLKLTHPKTLNSQGYYLYCVQHLESPDQPLNIAFLLFSFQDSIYYSFVQLLQA